MLNPEARENLKENLKNFPKDACMFLDTATVVGCEHLKDCNCRLPDRLDCEMLDKDDRTDLKKSAEAR